MSARGLINRQILLNITNMDDNSIDKTTDKSSIGAEVSGGGILRDVNGVKSLRNSADPTETLGAMADDSPSSGENINDSNTFESGGGGGRGNCDHDHEREREIEGGQTEDGIDTVGNKKRKTRRGKPKHRKLKPYSKQQISYEQRIKSRGISSRGSTTKTGRQPPAPYNTTQFLMEDHSDLPDLEQKLAAGVGETTALPIFQKPIAPPRTRDSSFSIDSDDDYFYSSPEDEEEFLTKEFSSAYEDLHAERLGGLTKSELIQEYIQLESKVDLLTKRLRGKNFHQMEERDGSGSDIEVAKKLKICQQRIDDLIQQNEQLKRENDALKIGQRRGGSLASSVDSESDSDTSSDTSSCSCVGNSNSPLGSATTGSGNSQITIRRDVVNVTREQKLNGSCNAATVISTIRCTDDDSDDDSITGVGTDFNHSQKFTETSPKPNCNGTSIASNGHATTQELNGLPT